MNKYIKAGLITTAIILSLLVVLRLSGMVTFFTVPTPSNEPNIKVGSRLFATTFKSPKQNDFVVYQHPFSDSLNSSFLPDKKSGQYYIHRFCATQKDIIQMKGGVLFVNGKNTDKELNLYHYYTLPAKDIPLIEGIYEPDQLNVLSDSISLVNLTDEMVRKTGTRVLLTKWKSTFDSSSRNGPFIWLGQNEKHWTADDFGPLEVPKGYCFLLGDNRQNALDSRYVGFISLSDIKGVKL